MSLLIPIAISAIGTGISIAGREKTKESRIAAAQERFQQEEDSAKQQSLLRTRRLNTVLASQIANAGARGFTPESPSLFVVSADSINQFAQDENGTALALDYDRLNEFNAMKNSHAEFEAGVGSDILNFGKNIFEGTTFGSATPKKGPLQTGREAIGEKT